MHEACLHPAHRLREHADFVLAARAELAGIQALAVHGRTREDFFTGEAEYDSVAAVKAAVRIPVIVNGDVDTPEKAKLLASRMSVEEMADFIKVDSLAFLSIDGLYRAGKEPARNPLQPQFCDACFTGDYPTALTDLEGSDSNVRQLSMLGGAS